MTRASCRVIHLVNLALAATLVLMCPTPAVAFGEWQRNEFVINGGVQRTDLRQQYEDASYAGFTLLGDDGTIEGARRHEDWLRSFVGTTMQMRGILSRWRPANFANFTHNTNPCQNNPRTIYQALIDENFDPTVVDALWLWDEPTTKLDDPQRVDEFHCQRCESISDGDCFRLLEYAQALIEECPVPRPGDPRWPDSPWAAPVDDAFALVNLLPIQSNSYVPCYSADRAAAYRCYLKRYLDIYGRRGGDTGALGRPAPVLSVDHYPFQGGEPSTNEALAQGIGWYQYFEGLKIQNELAMEYSWPGYRIPMWRYVQVAPTDAQGWSGFPKLDHVRWQVYTAIAYGAKGIGYFSLGPWDGFKGGIWNEAGVTHSESRHHFLNGLNSELRNLGGTLANLDWVASYHTDIAATPLGPHTGIERLGDVTNVYNVVSRVLNDGGKALVSYFKHESGDDYLLIVNKDRTTGLIPPLASREFTIELTNSATVYEVSKLDGGLRLLTPSELVAPRSFKTTLLPGEGRLYKLADDVFEYIPNVNAVESWLDRTYYAHNKGVVMVDYATGWRTYVSEAFEPPYSCIDLAVDGTGVAAIYQGVPGVIPPGGGSLNGVAVYYDAELTQELWRWSNNTYGPANAVALSATRIFVGHKGASTGNVYVFDRSTFANQNMVTAQGLRVNDIEFHQGEGSYAWFVVAHQGGVKRFSTAGFGVQYTWNSPNPIVDVEATASYVFTASDNGTLGQVDRRTSTLGPNSYWYGENSNLPRVIDLALNPAGDKMMAATIKAGVSKFYRLTAFPSMEQGQTTTSPARCTHLDANLNALLATNAGVLSRNGSWQIESVEPRHEITSVDRNLRLECLPNPITFASKVRLTLPVSGKVRVCVLDVAGREVSVLKRDVLVAGVHEFNWSPPSGRAGIYYVAVETEQGRLTRKAVVIR